jgi:hypothetical protein
LVDIGDIPLLEAVVEPDSSPAWRLKVDVGVVVAVREDTVLTVWVTVGNRSGPVPDEGRMNVAIILVCVLGAALETPTHML